jgi:hypothetical protein
LTPLDIAANRMAEEVLDRVAVMTTDGALMSGPPELDMANSIVSHPDAHFARLTHD